MTVGAGRRGATLDGAQFCFGVVHPDDVAEDRIDVDEEEYRSNAMTVATAIGAGTKLGRATP